MGIEPIKSREISVDIKSALQAKAPVEGKVKEKDTSSEPSEKVEISSSRPEDEKKGVYFQATRHDVNRLKDGYDVSRDIAGVYAEEGPPDKPYLFRVDLTRLRYGAETKFLDIYTLINVGNGGGATYLPDNIPGRSEMGWNLSLGNYDTKNFKAVDNHGRLCPDAISGVKYSTLRNSVEFYVNKNVLRNMGWKDGEPLKLQMFTAADFKGAITDSLDEPGKKPWENEGKLTKFMDTSKSETIPSPRDDNWANDTIYFLLTDRFEDGDKTNNSDTQPGNLKRFQGGDLQGLINKLDYIKNLGVTAIWITPVVENMAEFFDADGYHGYWPMDFFKVDPHIGNMEKYKEFVNKAHERGMKVIFDIPLNHVAWEHPFTKDPSKKDWFHKIGDIKDWNDPYQLENGSISGLPDLAQENPEVYKYLLDVCKFWAKETGIDGYRLDAVIHVNREFWKKLSDDLRKELGPDFLLLGEVFHGDPKRIHPYQTDGLTSIMDMSLYFTIAEVFAHDYSMRVLADRMHELEATFEDPSIMGAFIDNHDFHRFITLAGNNGREKMKLALAFLLTVNRMPIIYYGTEATLDGTDPQLGHGDPENRKMMQFGKDPDMEQYIKTLIATRNNNEALKNGTFAEMYRDDQVFAYARVYRDKEAVIILNNSYQDQTREVPIITESSLKNGDKLKDVLTGREFTVIDGRIKANIHRKQPLILIPEKG